MQPQDDGIDQGTSSKTWAVFSLVSGLLSVLINFFSAIGLLVALVAVVSGGIALAKKQNKILSIPGILSGVLGIIVGAMLLNINTGIFTPKVARVNPNQLPSDITFTAYKNQGAISFEFPSTWKKAKSGIGLNISTFTDSSSDGKYLFNKFTYAYQLTKPLNASESQRRDSANKLINKQNALIDIIQYYSECTNVKAKTKQLFEQSGLIGVKLVYDCTFTDRSPVHGVVIVAKDKYNLEYQFNLYSTYNTDEASWSENKDIYNRIISSIKWQDVASPQ